MSGYLYNNYIKTGYYTGMVRSFDNQSISELLLMLVKSVISIFIVFSDRVTWVNIAILLFQILIIIVLILRDKKNFFKEKVPNVLTLE